MEIKGINMALIYIVEDDASIREIEMIALKNSNYTVSAFERASDFWNKIGSIIPDLVLLDVMLPDGDGYEIVRKLRQDPQTKRIPVIMVTAKTGERFEDWTEVPTITSRNRFQ